MCVCVYVCTCGALCFWRERPDCFFFVENPNQTKRGSIVVDFWGVAAQALGVSHTLTTCLHFHLVLSSPPPSLATNPFKTSFTPATTPPHVGA